MKTLKTFLLVAFFLPLLTACPTQFTMPENATIDQKFVGTWEGKHFDKKSGQLRKWTQTRKGDGTYSIQLKYFDKNKKLLSQTSETGHWWIKKDQFHEISPKNMKKPESYLYRFIGKDKIKFITVNDKSDYSFIDTRVSK